MMAYTEYRFEAGYNTHPGAACTERHLEADNIHPGAECTERRPEADRADFRRRRDRGAEGEEEYFRRRSRARAYARTVSAAY